MPCGIFTSVYRGAIVFDGHMDTALRIVDEGVDLGRRTPEGHADLPRMREGGLDAAFLAAWVDPAYAPDRARERCETLLSAIRDVAETHADRAGFAASAAEVREIVAAGRIALLAGIENGQALEGRLENVERFRELGVRYMTLTWMRPNELGDAGGGETVHGGLTDFGRAVVREMERLGMLVDLAHASPATFWDALDVAAGPVVVSHAATEVRGRHPRNLSDDQIRAVGETGGLVGIAFMPAYLSPEAASPPDFTAIVDHLERLVEVAGIDHAALGSDFDGVPGLPAGIDGVQDLPRIAAELERRGWAASDLARVLGENWLRVIEAVDRVATTPPRR